MLDDIRMFLRFAAGLRPFLGSQVTDEDCRRRLLEQLQSREESFLLLMDRAVYAYADSPYRKLLEWAGIEFHDLSKLVREN